MTATEVTGLDLVPRPIAVAPEMAALRRFHPERVSWEGFIQADGMGPGTPAMTAAGGGEARLIQGGRWIVGDYWQDQLLLDGTFVLRWELHWVAGWDPQAGEYRATTADNYGHAVAMRGRVEGDRLIFESMPGELPRLRMVWDAAAEPVIRWRNEVAPDGEHFMLVEEYALSRV